MKKSVIFTIAIIYLMSIFIVTLFGMKIKVDQFEIYMSDLQITNYDKINKKGIKTKTLYFDTETDEYISFFIEYEYKPENISYPEKVRFSLSGQVQIFANASGDPEEIEIATVNANGQVVFTHIGEVTAKVYATDGSGKSDIMILSCLKKTTT